MELTKTLPPNPAGVRYLLDGEAQWMKSRYGERELWVPDECRICEGTKSFRWYDLAERGGAVYDYECDCVGQWVLHRFFLAAGILLRYQCLGWADVSVDTEQALDWILHADAHRRVGHGLIFSGPTSTGKTLVAVLLLKHLMAVNGWTGRWLTATELTDAFAEGWERGDAGREARRWFNRYVRGVDLLVLDDLGQESQVEGKRPTPRAMAEVLNYRYGACLPTLLLTRSSVRELVGTFPDAGIDRAFDVVLTSARSGVMAEKQREAITESLQKLTRPVVVG